MYSRAQDIAPAEGDADATHVVHVAVRDAAAWAVRDFPGSFSHVAGSPFEISTPGTGLCGALCGHGSATGSANPGTKQSERPQAARERTVH